MGFNICKSGVNEWHLDVRIRKAGREFRRRETFHGNRPQADERYMHIKKELRHGALSSLPHKPKTFGDLLEVYKEKRQPFVGRSHYRLNQMQRNFGSFELVYFADKFEAYMKNFRVTPLAITKKPPANGTLNAVVLMVKAVFNLALHLEIVEKNPISWARFPKFREVPRDRVLSEDETVRLLRAVNATAPYLEPIVRYALAVPCRKSELINMLRDDMDPFSNAIRVRNGTTKNDEGCWKPIPPEMVPYFRSIPPECPYLFYRFEKGVYSPLRDFSRAWGRCLTLAKIGNFRFHDTRHISASEMVDAGTPEQVVMQVAGWKTPMLRTYYHRSGKQSLGLVRFGPGSGRLVDTTAYEREKIS